MKTVIYYSKKKKSTVGFEQRLFEGETDTVSCWTVPTGTRDMVLVWFLLLTDPDSTQIPKCYLL